MGNHGGFGRDGESSGPCLVAVRGLAAGAAAAAIFLMLGLPGIPATPPVATGPVSGIGHSGKPGPAPAILTNNRALVPFSRTIVGTVAKGGSAPLKVASAGLKRPPEGSLMAPLEALASSSPFGFRISPITGSGGDFHLGQDFAAECGTRVYSADAGVVRAAGWHPWGGGNRVEIDHGNGLITTYNHLEAIAVRTGESVQVGQVIARVGTTGWSTGCHLHFETILRGVHTSPLGWKLLPILQVDRLSYLAMVSYEGKRAAAASAQPWAIPVAEDNSHTVLGGEDELAEVPNTATPTPTAASPSPTPTAASPSPTPTPTATSTTTPPTPTPTATSPSPTPTATSPSPTPTATSTTTPPAPTPTATSPSPTPTATSPSPTGTSTTTPPTPTPTATSPSPTVSSASPSPTPTVSSTSPTPTATTEQPTSTPTATPTDRTPSPTRTSAGMPSTPAGH